jgi:hypothetical protein
VAAISSNLAAGKYTHTHTPHNTHTTHTPHTTAAGSWINPSSTPSSTPSNRYTTPLSQSMHSLSSTSTYSPYTRPSETEVGGVGGVGGVPVGHARARATSIGIGGMGGGKEGDRGGRPYNPYRSEQGGTPHLTHGGTQHQSQQQSSSSKNSTSTSLTALAAARVDDFLSEDMVVGRRGGPLSDGLDNIDDWAFIEHGTGHKQGHK